jgi:hypothetical protein
MLDVHPPQHISNTWREVLLHIAIVTVGLFIALTLEAVVENFHHRHLVREARENIRIELQHNHDAAQRTLGLLQTNVERQKANIRAIHGLMEEGKHFHGNVDNTMDMDSPTDAAWHTARDTGALGYMPYAEVQRYSDIYQLGDIIDKTSVDIARQDFDAAAPFYMGYEIDKLPPTEYQRLLHDNATVEIELASLRQFVQQYDTAVLDELNHH